MLNRREFFKIASIAAGTAGLSRCAWAIEKKTKKAISHPNIVFILADDMGYGDLACQNPESKIPTPNLDHLAAEGMRFTEAHSPSAVCTPTRYGILTGRYCWRSRLKKSVLWQWEKSLIEKDRLTVPMVLREEGYSTACIGKWHLGWDWVTKDGSELTRKDTGRTVDFTKPIGGGPLAAGFDYYFGDDVPNLPPYCFIENNRTIGIPTVIKPKKMYGVSGIMMDGWKLDWVMPAITDKAVDYIDKAAQKDNPFLLYFAQQPMQTIITRYEIRTTLSTILSESVLDARTPKNIIYIP